MYNSASSGVLNINSFTRFALGIAFILIESNSDEIFRSDPRVGYFAKGNPSTNPATPIPPLSSRTESVNSSERWMNCFS